MPDEPVEDVIAAFNSGPKGVTERPEARSVLDPENPCHVADTCTMSDRCEQVATCRQAPNRDDLAVWQAVAMLGR